MARTISMIQVLGVTSLIFCLWILLPDCPRNSKNHTHNVLTAHWAITGFCNYCMPLEVCIIWVFISCTVAYVCIFLDCTEIACVVQDHLFSCFALMQKVKLNFGCLGCVRGYCEKSQMTPRSAGVVSWLWGGKFCKGCMNQTFRGGGTENIRWMTSRLQSIVGACFSLQWEAFHVLKFLWCVMCVFVYMHKYLRVFVSWCLPQGKS